MIHSDFISNIDPYGPIIRTSFPHRFVAELGNRKKGRQRKIDKYTDRERESVGKERERAREREIDR